MTIAKVHLPAAAVFLAAATALLAWGLPAQSQDRMSHDGEPPHRMESVTMDQFVARQSERIMAADSDGDGRISRAEMAAMPARGGQDPMRMFDAMDTNHDGYLDKGEIRAALEMRFHRLDTNGDGILTPEERMAARMQHEPQDPPAGPAASHP